LGRSVGRLIATLCTFEPDLVPPPPPTKGSPPLISSAHAHVMMFHEQELIWKLHRWFQLPTKDHDNDDNTTMTTSSTTRIMDSYLVLALRAMAINNDIVQAVVAVGLLKQAQEMLWTIRRSLADTTTASSSESQRQPDASTETLATLVALVGLFRNVCANDQVKTSLCLGNKVSGQESIVEPLLELLQTFPQHALFQEHGCGTFAAMALRQPDNCHYLVQTHQVHVAVLAAMRQHPHRATLQRQGALCLRNLVSRGDQAVLRTALLDAQAGPVLLQIAAQHASCQDEVYAALRDLGIAVNILNVKHDENGQVTVQKTEMFGDFNEKDFMISREPPW